MAGSGSGSGICKTNHENWGIRVERQVVNSLSRMALAVSVTVLTLTLTLTMMSTTGLDLGQKNEEPMPRAWPEQFHAVLVLNNTKTSELQVIDLWYDWPNGRNLNLIQHQLGKRLYDVEWNNGTSFYYNIDGECRTVHIEVGILRPNWLEGSTYLGQRYMDGFLCNVWFKADFIWYYEDVLTKRPVHWLFYTGRAAHVMTFEVGAVLEDSQWQAPIYCFDNYNQESVSDDTRLGVGLPLLRPHPLAFI